MTLEEKIKIWNSNEPVTFLIRKPKSEYPGFVTSMLKYDGKWFTLSKKERSKITMEKWLNDEGRVATIYLFGWWWKLECFNFLDNKSVND